MTNGLYRCFSGLGLGSCFSCFNVFRRSNHNATNQDTKASADLVFVGSDNNNKSGEGGVNSSPDANVEVDPNQNLEPSPPITFTTPVPPLDSFAGPDLSQSLATNQSQNGFLLQQSDQNPASELTLPSNDMPVLPVESEPDENDLHSSTGFQDQGTLIRPKTPRVLRVITVLAGGTGSSININRESVMLTEEPKKPGAEPANSLNRNSPSLTTPRELDIEGLEGKLKLAEIDLSTKLKMSSLEFDAPRNPSPIPLELKINFSINPQNNVSLVSQEERQFSTTPDGVFLLNNQQAREFESQRKAEALQIFAIPSTNSIGPKSATRANYNTTSNCLWV